MRSVRATELGQAFAALHKEVGATGSPVLVEADGTMVVLLPIERLDDVIRLESALDSISAEEQMAEYRQDPSTFVPVEQLRREMESGQDR